MSVGHQTKTIKPSSYCQYTHIFYCVLHTNKQMSMQAITIADQTIVDGLTLDQPYCEGYFVLRMGRIEWATHPHQGCTANHWALRWASYRDHHHTPRLHSQGPAIIWALRWVATDWCPHTTSRLHGHEVSAIIWAHRWTATEWALTQHQGWTVRDKLTIQAGVWGPLHVSKKKKLPENMFNRTAMCWCL